MIPFKLIEMKFLSILLFMIFRTLVYAIVIVRHTSPATISGASPYEIVEI